MRISIPRSKLNDGSREGRGLAVGTWDGLTYKEPFTTTSPCGLGAHWKKKEERKNSSCSNPANSIIIVDKISSI